MTTYTGYAIEMTVAHETGWVRVINNGMGHLEGITVTNNPFEATVYGTYSEALEILDKIRKMPSYHQPSGATTLVVTFHLKTE